MTDLFLKRKSKEVESLEKWLTNGPRYFLLRHESVIRPLLKHGLRAVGLLARGERNALRPVIRDMRLAFNSLPPGFAASASCICQICTSMLFPDSPSASLRRLRLLPQHLSRNAQDRPRGPVPAWHPRDPR
jgi:hypothetical protein